MTVQINQRKPGHDRLEQHRFLLPYRELFTHRADGSSWPRWQNTAAMAPAYLRGLLRPGSGKNMHGIAKSVDLDDDPIERFVRESPWEYADVQKHLIDNVPNPIRSPDAVIVVDDVALVKKGKMSVAAYRQWCGATGKVDECQVAVDLIYSRPNPERNADQMTWPLGMQLYVPSGWLEEPEYDWCRSNAELPKNVEFRTKHQIAMELIDQARHLPHQAIGGDAGYGDNADFRRQLRDRKEPYVLGVSPSTCRVIPADTPITEPHRTDRRGQPATHLRHARSAKRRSPRSIANDVTEWETIEWNEGTKDTLTGQFWRTQVRVVEGREQLRWATDEVVWLLLERRSNELKAYFCWGFDDATLPELVAIAHQRWTIEQFHREAKQMLGLDQFEGRTWRGWHHHVTLVLLAYAYLALQRSKGFAKDVLPTLPATARAIVLEMATQEIVSKHKIKRPKARSLALTVLRGFSEWDG